MLSFVQPKAGYREARRGALRLGPQCLEAMEEVEGALPHPQADKAKQRTRRHLIEPSYLFQREASTIHNLCVVRFNKWTEDTITIVCC